MTEEVCGQQFKCKRCNALFAKKQGLQRHLGRKVPCVVVEDAIDSDEIEIKSVFSCPHCARNFSQSGALTRHIARCEPISGAKNARITALETENEILRGRVAELLAMISDVTLDDVYDTSEIEATSRFHFLQEPLSHITHLQIYESLMEYPAGKDEKTNIESAEYIVTRIAESIFSDSTRPECISCFALSSKDSEALVFGEHGWEARTTTAVIRPMVKRAIGQLFGKQPWPGLNDVPQRANLDLISPVLRAIEKNENAFISRFMTTAAPDFRIILSRNCDMLRRTLGAVPKVGEQN